MNTILIVRKKMSFNIKDRKNADKISLRNYVIKVNLFRNSQERPIKIEMSYINKNIVLDIEIKKTLHCFGSL